MDQEFRDGVKDLCYFLWGLRHLELKFGTPTTGQQHADESQTILKALYYQMMSDELKRKAAKLYEQESYGEEE